MIDYGSLETLLDQDWYALDPDLQAHVHRHCPPEDLEFAERKLGELGRLVGSVIARNAEVVDANPPRLERYDRWATEVGEVVHHPAMLESKRALWRVGYVGSFAADEAARGRAVPGVVRGAAGYLLSQADTGLVCSTGMTSGVAELVAAYAPPDVREALLPGLLADDPERGLDGSMFLTERDGGSDLGRTVHCTAKDLGDGRVLINGEKWFCSNLDGAAIVLLARPEGAPEGPKGLGLYLVPRELPDGSRNGIHPRRLKDKLGTKSVPTGEVEFRDALGYALRPQSGEGAGSDAGGLNRMMEMVNGSRFGVAMMGLGISRRCFAEAAVWCHHRRAKGRLLVDLPLVREQLVDLLAELEAASALGFECTAAGRRAEGGLLRRMLVPVAKIRLTRLGVEAASAAIELHGGNGYCEDWGLTRQLRDAQCHPIWEGTEHICRLDVLRAIRRDGAERAVFARVDAALEAAAGGPSLLDPAVGAVRSLRDRLAARVGALGEVEPDEAEAWSALLADGFARMTSAALLAEHAAVDAAQRGDFRKALVALRFARRRLLAEEDRYADAIAREVGRELLAYAALDEDVAAKAAA
jgi:acyl-CoA dehydrogenase